jgi:hypothetical protein
LDVSLSWYEASLLLGANVGAGSYPLYVNVWNKEVMDTHRATMVGVEPVSDKALQLEGQTSRVEDVGRQPATEIQ